MPECAVCDELLELLARAASRDGATPTCAVCDELLGLLAHAASRDAATPTLICVRGPLHKQRRPDALEARWTDPVTGVVHLYTRTTLRDEHYRATFFAYDGLELMRKAEVV